MPYFQAQSQEPVSDLLLQQSNVIPEKDAVTQSILNRIVSPRVAYPLKQLAHYSEGFVKTIWDVLPPFSQQSLQLLYLDFLPLLTGYSVLCLLDNRYAAYEPQLPVVFSYIVSTVLATFRYALLLLAWLYKPQSWIHSSVLLLKSPSEWQKIPKEAAQKLDVSCCDSCNKLREIKGDVRSIVLYCFQQLVLSLIRIFSLGSVIGFVPHILMTGRMLAEYRYRTEGVCDRHIEQTYQQNWEFFAVLGLVHFLGGAASNWFCATLLNMPADAVEPCMSGLMMLGIVRLTYAMKKFPYPAEKAIRHFPIPDPTRWVVETGIDFAAFQFKQNLRNPTAAIAMLEGGRTLIGSTSDFFVQLTAWCKQQYQKQAQNSGYIAKLPIKQQQFAMPFIFLSKDRFFDDPVVGRWCLDQIDKWRKALSSFLEYRQLMLTISNTLSPFSKLEKWRHSIAVKIPLYFVGGVVATLNDMFTLNFIKNDCDKYLGFIAEAAQFLFTMKIITEQRYQKIVGVIKKLNTNLNVLRRILNELPESSREEFFNLIQDESVAQYILSVVKYLESILGAYAYGFDEIDPFDMEPIDSCVFPETTSCNLIASNTVSAKAAGSSVFLNGGKQPLSLFSPLSSPSIVPTAASAATAAAGGGLPSGCGVENWDEVSQGSIEQPTLPKDSDSDWDDSDCQLERKMY